LNILIVDDEKSVTASIEMVLKRSGHTVDVLHDGDDALARLEELPAKYEVLITDHFMRRLSGLQLLQELREKPFKGRIIVLSGYLTNELEAECRSAGAHKIIRKPFDLHELRTAVGELSSRQ